MKSIDSARDLVSFIEKELHVAYWEDWYKIRTSTIKKLVPKQTILKEFDHSLPKLLSHVYPNHPWLPWRFEQLPFHFWKDIYIQRQFMDYISKELSIKQQEDWYKVSNADIRSFGGKGIEIIYDHSIGKLLSTIYSDKTWNITLFKKESRTFLSNEDIHKTFLEEISLLLDIKKLDDWYLITSEQIASKHRGDVLLSKYSYSIVKLVTCIYPNHTWELFKFKECKIYRKIFDILAMKLGIISYEQWYFITRTSIIQESGILSIIEIYNNSLITTLMSLYPEYPWKPWLFGKVSNRFWKERKNQRLFFNWLSKELSIKSIDDWYHVTVAQVEQHGGTGVIQAHGNALNIAIMNAHPEYEWQEWRFQKTQRNMWNNDDKARKAIEWASNQLSIHTLDEWNHVTHASLTTLGLRGLVEKHGGVQKMMIYYYPNHTWKSTIRNSWDFQVSIGKSHQMLFEALHKLFNKKEDNREDIEIHMNYIHPEIHFSSSGFNVEFDIFIPTLSIAFEYQGSQHYSISTFFPIDMKITDKEKRELCILHGITLIEIPYWWNERLEDLSATIIKYRPDLKNILKIYSIEYLPISNEPPIGINHLSKAKDWSIK